MTAYKGAKLERADIVYIQDPYVGRGVQSQSGFDIK